MPIPYTSTSTRSPGRVKAEARAHRESPRRSRRRVPGSSTRGSVAIRVGTPKMRSAVGASCRPSQFTRVRRHETPTSGSSWVVVMQGLSGRTRRAPPPRTTPPAASAGRVPSRRRRWRSRGRAPGPARRPPGGPGGTDDRRRLTLALGGPRRAVAGTDGSAGADRRCRRLGEEDRRVRGHLPLRSVAAGGGELPRMIAVVPPRSAHVLGGRGWGPAAQHGRRQGAELRREPSPPYPSRLRRGPRGPRRRREARSLPPHVGRLRASEHSDGPLPVVLEGDESQAPPASSRHPGPAGGALHRLHGR